MYKTNKLRLRGGFTLIEMLIVIAIIGILASVVLVGLGPIRSSGRDARRQSDLRSVQNALELYFSKCGHYPGGGNCDDAVGNPDWDGMATALETAGIGVSDIPNDPSSAAGADVERNYQYATDAGGTKYVLSALFEKTDNPSLTDSLKTVPDGISITCDEPGRYCISL